MSEPRLRITCDNGNYTGATLYLDGKPVTDAVTEVNVTIRTGEYVTATVTFEDVALDILAHDKQEIACPSNAPSPS